MKMNMRKVCLHHLVTWKYIVNHTQLSRKIMKKYQCY